MNNYFKANGANQPAIVLAVLVAAAAALMRVARREHRRAQLLLDCRRASPSSLR